MLVKSSVDRTYLGKYWKIAVLYVMLSAGGLWHALGVLEYIMRISAAPMMIALALWLAYENRPVASSHGDRHADPTFWSLKRRFVAWSFGVVAISWGVEAIGVQSGAIFGSYSYGTTLVPALFGAPLAIGFAWLGMLLASSAVAFATLARISTRFHTPLFQALLIALFMTAFDIIMEPAAVILDYWTWADGYVPLRNYAAWFVLSFAFAATGLKLRCIMPQPSPVAFHAYFAQIVYFCLARLGGVA